MKGSPPTRDTSTRGAQALSCRSLIIDALQQPKPSPVSLASGRVPCGLALPPDDMRAIVSILSATLAGSVLLQGYWAIWHPSSYGRFAEFPAVLLYAAVISTVFFLVFVLPLFVWMQRRHRNLSLVASSFLGLIFGLLAMFLFLALTRWPMHPSLFIAGSVAGAIEVSIYARFSFKRVG